MVLAMVREIKLFGALKKFGEKGAICVDAPRGIKVSSLREMLKVKISERYAASFRGELIDRSAIAIESTLLRDEDLVPDDGVVVVLPPVCGG